MLDLLWSTELLDYLRDREAAGRLQTVAMWNARSTAPAAAAVWCGLLAVLLLDVAAGAIYTSHRLKIRSLRSLGNLKIQNKLEEPRDNI